MNSSPSVFMMISRGILAAILLSCANAGRAELRTYSIDEDHFSLIFLVDHIGYARQIGQFLEAEGSFQYDLESNRLSGGEVTVAADSVFTNHRRRDRHLRNADFLDASQYPDIRFSITGHRPGQDQQHQVEGELTLLGQTRPVTLDVTLNKSGDYPIGHGQFTLGLSARTTILRSDWGMDYGIAEGLVGDEVALMFEFEAIAQ